MTPLLLRVAAALVAILAAAGVVSGALWDAQSLARTRRFRMLPAPQVGGYDLCSCRDGCFGMWV